jgi:type IV pilus assembly protein PilC
MPYFSWYGVDLRGKTRTGKLFARSEKDLNSTLLKRDIAVMRCHQSAPLFLRRSIPLSCKLYFFQQLSVLLSSGILLPDALKILSEQVDHVYFQEIVGSLVDAVRSGVPLSDALNRYPAVFHGVMITMVQAGQESGSLAASLAALSDYLETDQLFRKRLLSAALGPLFTLGFFIVVSLIIFIGIIPRFATIFIAVNHDLPYLTTVLVAISSFVSSWRMLVVGVLMAMMALVAQSYVRSEQGRWTVSRWSLRMPFIGPIVKKSFVVYFLRSLALLLEGGVPLVSALAIAKGSISNKVLQEYVQDVQYEVEAGSSLSQAMAVHQEDIFGQDILAIVSVGEESGNLGSTLRRLAGHYQEKVQRMLTLITTLIQPLFMIILGVLVTLLILAVYLPIFNLAHVIT